MHDLEKAGVLLQNLDPVRDPSHKADIQNSRATILEFQGTIATVQQAVEIRIELPKEYYFDLAYTLLRLSTLVRGSSLLFLLQ